MPRQPWNERYATGDVPWDSDEPNPCLVELVESGRIALGRTLEVGCGTGTNALWLASRGFDVLGIDLAPLAIERARVRPGASDGPSKGLAGRCRFKVSDFMNEARDDGPFELVFDRGCFHVFDEAEVRSSFATRVASALSPGGVWLSLIGSTEGLAREEGPPRRSARDIVTAIEPVLEILDLRCLELETKAWWVCLSRRRALPAQPSTGE